jgi:hypothetical protein
MLFRHQQLPSFTCSRELDTKALSPVGGRDGDSTSAAISVSSEDYLEAASRAYELAYGRCNCTSFARTRPGFSYGTLNSPAPSGGETLQLSRENGPENGHG